jgi:2-keto-4-pentenoate hydratase
MIDKPLESVLPGNRSEAYFVQDQMANRLEFALAGWKVGATSSKMRELDGHDNVIPGRIFEPVSWQGNRLSLDASRFPQARAETEFAFLLLRHIPVRERPWTADEIINGLSFHPAIEIIRNRHALPDSTAPVRSLMTITDNGGGIGFVFGDAVANWQDVDFQTHIIQLQV